MRRETSDGQTSDWQCAGKRIPLLTTGNIVQGDFGTSLEMTVRHVPLCSLPADWYLRPLRTLTACSACILQRMRESAKVGP